MASCGRGRRGGRRRQLRKRSRLASSLLRKRSRLYLLRLESEAVSWRVPFRTAALSAPVTTAALTLFHCRCRSNPNSCFLPQSPPGSPRLYAFGSRRRLAVSCARTRTRRATPIAAVARCARAALRDAARPRQARLAGCIVCIVAEEAVARLHTDRGTSPSLQKLKHGRRFWRWAGAPVPWPKAF